MLTPAWYGNKKFFPENRKLIRVGSLSLCNLRYSSVCNGFETRFIKNMRTSLVGKNAHKAACINKINSKQGGVERYIEFDDRSNF